MNGGAAATVRIVDNGIVLVGHRLPPNGGRSFAPVVLTLPSGIHAGDTLAIIFIAQQGTIYLDSVGVSASPSGGPVGAAIRP
jgi:hypothetical protein